MPPAIGRNDPCPCGSGKKFKKCCGQQESGREDAQALMQHAAQLHRLGRPADAVSTLSKALALQPNSLDILHALAQLAGEMGQHAEAVLRLQQALRIAPDQPQLLGQLSDALLHAQRPGEAIETLARLVRLTPDDAATHYNLGTLLKQEGRLEDALPHFQRAIELNPQDPDCHNNLANTLSDLGRTEEAIAAYTRAIVLAPGLVQAHLNLAVSLQNQGHFDQAWDRYQTCLQANGSNGAAYHGMSALRRFTAEDGELIARMEDYKHTPGLPDAELAEVCFALGKVFNDLAQYPRAFENYHLGNSLIRRHLDFHQDEQVMRAERVMQVFNRDTLSRPETWRNASSKPIFIIGMPRSGTSLVEQIVASHPLVHGAGELDFWRDEDEKLYPNYIRQLPKKAAGIAQRYLELLTRLGGSAERVTDKLPGNFWHLGLIHAIFPNARIIHCKRNPVDTCLSIYFQKFAGDHPYAYELDELACYYRLYRRLTRYWRNVLPAHVYTEVQYEDLITQQESETRRLIEFCGLEWSDQCLNFHQKQRTVKTASSWQVRQPLYASSRERWRNYETFIGPLVKLLHETDDSPSSSPTRPKTPSKSSGKPKSPGGRLKRAA